MCCGTGRVAGSSRSVACCGKCLCPNVGPWGCYKHPWQHCSSWPRLRKQLTWIWAGLCPTTQCPCSWNHMSLVWLKLLACGMGNVFSFSPFYVREAMIHSDADLHVSEALLEITLGCTVLPADPAAGAGLCLCPSWDSVPPSPLCFPACRKGTRLSDLWYL